MNPTPNAFQKLIHRVIMLRSVTAFFAPRIHRIDQAILELTKGKYTASEILGWNIVLLITVGAKSAQLRSMPLMALFDGEKIALIASSFGSKHNPAWYYNLKAHPECKVQSNAGTGTYPAHEAAADEYKKYWQLAVA